MRIELDNVNKRFGDNHVLKNLSFAADNGKAFGLLGRNGAGKTTAIRIIMGIFPADSGSVRVSGGNGEKTRIGYLPEERGLYPKRVISEQMVYFGVLRGLKSADARKRAKSLLEKLDAGEYFNRKLDTLSKGNQQKIQLALAMINDPEVLILDEPFSGLDPVNASVLKGLVLEMVAQGKLVIFSSHQMANVEEFCDDLCMIDKGTTVLSGNLRAIKKSYPRNRILITPEDGDFAALSSRLSQTKELMNIAESFTVGKKGCVAALRSEGDKNRLMLALNEMGVGIDTFQVMEPTLEEIFIEKAGSNNEEV